MTALGVVAATVDCRAILGIEDDAPLLAPNMDGGDHADVPFDASRSDDGGDGGADGTSLLNIDRTEPQWLLPVASPPPSNYEVTDDTVLDKTTGLMWQRKIEGQPRQIWPEPPRVCAKLELAGYHDWRLPTRIEMVSLFDFGEDAPAVNPVLFPAAPAYALHWTISPYVVERRTAARWATDPFTGWSWFYDEYTSSESLPFRCVRAGNVSNAQPRFTVLEGQATVRDARTGLVWERGTAPKQSFADAKHRCESFRPPGYRLPNARELQTLIDETQTEVPIWYRVFDRAVQGTTTLWSSTYRRSHDGYILTDFVDGHSSPGWSNTVAGVRCVR
ncbi:DUF1566 domain-containing protein [Pendulispora rubella]|uniref:DUF1566 domain-containing protein n=1 Tax=Pendulispora rubella TaxID=2741070 RepID=A0ABZ2KT76_9BACT